MNFINVNADNQVGNIPTSNANYIGIVYSNVLNSSLSYYLPTDLYPSCPPSPKVDVTSILALLDQLVGVSLSFIIMLLLN